jgi:hypothetical protein
VRVKRAASGVLGLVATAVNRPAKVFAVNAGETPIPFRPVVTVAVSLPFAKPAPAPDPLELPPPEPASVKVTVAPITGLSFASRSRTASLSRYWRPTVCEYRPLPTTASRGLAPGRFNSRKIAGVLTCATDANARKYPPDWFAANFGETAIPELLLRVVAELLPAVNAAPALSPPPAFALPVPGPPPLAVEPRPPSVKVTVTPDTGSPSASSTSTDNGCRYVPAAMARWCVGERAVTAAGMPAAVLLSEKLADP